MLQLRPKPSSKLQRMYSNKRTSRYEEKETEKVSTNKRVAGISYADKVNRNARQETVSTPVNITENYSDSNKLGLILQKLVTSMVTSRLTMLEVKAK